MAGFVQPIIQGLQVLKEHKAQLAAQEQQKQQTLQQIIAAAVIHHIQNQGGNQNG